MPINRRLVIFAAFTPKTYYDIGHYAGPQNRVWYISKNGRFSSRPMLTKNVVHQVKEGDYLAVGRIDGDHAAISVRHVYVTQPDGRQIPQPISPLDWRRIIRLLQRQYPGYAIWYFGDGYARPQRMDGED